MKKLAFAAALVSLTGGAALAQTTTPPKPATPPASESAPKAGMNAGTQAGASAGGITMADTATMALRFVAVQPADFMWSRLTGANVYNKQNETVGTIEDLVIENGKTVKGVIVAVGGFLGMGESYVVLDPATIVVSQRDGTWRAAVDTSKDTLKNAPKFEYKKMKR